jgi:hypothetical protein
MRYHAFECSEPRDVVFALQGLIGKGYPRIKVDYSRTVAEFFLFVVVHLQEMEMTNDQKLIRLAAFLFRQMKLDDTQISLTI